MYFITSVKCTYMNKKDMEICVKWTFCYTNYKSMCKSCDTCRINIVTKTGCARSWLCLIVKYVGFSALTRTMWKTNKYDGMLILIRFFVASLRLYTSPLLPPVPMGESYQPDTPITKLHFHGFSNQHQPVRKGRQFLQLTGQSWSSRLYSVWMESHIKTQALHKIFRILLEIISIYLGLVFTGV